MSDFLVSVVTSPERNAFSIGSISVQWYGLLIVCGMLLGLLYACWQAKRIGLTTDDTVELFLWLIPLAIVFARLLYVIPRADEYFGNNGYEGWDKFVHIIAIWEGGITIIGGLVGGLLGALFFTLRHKDKVNFLNVVDLVVVPVFIGQIIGRWGNFVNQEAFGIPITNEALQFFPFAVFIQDPSGVSSEFLPIVREHIANGIVVDGVKGNYFCATFFYEGFWNTIGAIACFVLWQKNCQKKYPGVLMIFYLVWYCLGRFWLEYLRMDAVPITKIAMIIVAVLALVIGGVYIVAHTSQLSYRKLRSLAQDGIEGAALTEQEISNYKFVGKLFEAVNKDASTSKEKCRAFFANILLKLCYVRKDAEDYIQVDFDTLEYYHVPKGYKQRFKNIAKSEDYTK